MSETVYLLFYRGKSLISRAIQLQTRSKYSHVAIGLQDGTIYEAWHDGGVCHREDYMEGHSAGTVIDRYEIKLNGYQYDELLYFLNEQVGKKYDFRNVFRFLTRVLPRKNDRWFCSELVQATFTYAGKPLLNIRASLSSPRDLHLTPYILDQEPDRLIV